MVTNPTEIVPRDDEAEARLYSPYGVGEVLTDEEIKMYSMNQFGIGDFPPDVDR